MEHRGGSRGWGVVTVLLLLHTRGHHLQHSLLGDLISIAVWLTIVATTASMLEDPPQILQSKLMFCVPPPPFSHFLLVELSCDTVEDIHNSKDLLYNLYNIYVS